MATFVSTHLPLLSLGALFSVLSFVLLGECSEFPKEPLIMTTLPQFGQKTHTCLSFDAVLNFLTFCEAVQGDANAATHKKLASIVPPSTLKYKVKNHCMLVTS